MPETRDLRVECNSAIQDRVMHDSARERHARSTRLRSACAALAVALAFAALPAPARAQGGSRSAEAAKREATLATMKQLINAMFGTGDSAGYIADMGKQPTSLSDLTAAAGTSPAYSVGNLGGVGMGYG